MNYIITKEEHLDLLEKGKASLQLLSFWKDLVEHSPKEIFNELKDAAFSLGMHPTLSRENSQYSYNLAFIIPGASEEVTAYLELPEHVVICLDK